MIGLTREELRQVLAAARAHRERDWLMILVAYRHGLRVSELIAIKSLDIADDVLRVRRLKGSRHTIQPLMRSDDELLDERSGLLNWIRGMPANQRLFEISKRRFEQIFRQHCDQCGVPKHKAHPHALKHSLALHLLEIVPVNVVQQALGHVSGANTLAYLRMSDSEAWAAIEKARKF